ncbi:MAG TPA: uracil-DNA glycosylase [Gemmatimonadales bacterium]|nr:uracil-DNA glycosylase [Gemmatimonadales bacterium]
MTDPRDLFATYVRQRVALGERALFLERQRPVEHQAPAKPADSPLRDLAREANSPRDPGPRPRAEPRARKADWRRDAPPIPPPGIVIPTPAEDLFTSDPVRGATLEKIASLVRECRKCALCEGRRNAVPGEGPPEARLVVVGEGPGATEDETGRPFVGRAGELLTEILAAIELPRERVFICNIVKCRPPNNRRPQQDEIDACVPYLYAQLAHIRPAVIVAMGGTAAETLLNTKQSLASLRNRVHSFRGTPLIVTYHPAALLRNPHWKKPTWDDVRIARQLLDAHA